MQTITSHSKTFQSRTCSDVCGEMVHFSIIFEAANRIKTYTGRSYLVEANHYGSMVKPRVLGGFPAVKALLAALIVSDLVKETLVAPRRLLRGRLIAKDELASGGEALSKAGFTDASPFASLVPRPQKCSQEKVPAGMWVKVASWRSVVIMSKDRV